MLKNIFFVFILSMQNLVFAHSVVLSMADNNDGTMEIFGGFSTGQSAAGAKIIIKSKVSSKVLYENRVPNSGIITIKIPTEPYSVILDSGPGHVLEKSGKLIPKSGFKKDLGSSSYSLAFLVTLSLSLFFVFTSFFLSLKKARLVNKA